MYLVTIWLPFITAIIIGLFGSKIGALSASKIAVTSATITCILSLIVFYEVALQHAPTYIEIFNWFDSEMVSFSWGFMFDSLTATMLVVITTISMCVHWYSIEYMYTDPHKQRFMAYLSLFTFFMLILVTADNFFQLFLGWEGVGLCSYLLINFWYGRLQANKAAIKAILVNRIGDIGLALGIFLIYYLFNSLDYAVVFALAPHFKDYSIVFFNYEVNALTLICFFFFIGATGKSAQIGLHTWLPDAMEGPTPVSALIHAATMVTAGVFLAVRCSPLFEYAPAVSFIMTISGALTAFIAATIGMVQNDLKRVIAYSTCSQLGYMMIACGTSGYAIGMFHLTNHAFFKALLFLSAGSIIHALSDEQDMRRMGGLLNILPFTYNMMFIGSLSLMGFPFLTGFYSKDLILEWTYAHYSINSYFAYGLGSVSAFITAFYSMRVLSLTFLKKPLSNKIILTQAHEPNYFMTVPLIFLGICSIFVGYFLKDMMVGLGTDFWGNSIYVLPQNMLLIEAEFLEQHIKLLPVILSLLGGIVSFVSYNFAYKGLYLLKISYLGKKLYTFLNRKWFFDKVYNEIFAQNTLIFSYNNGYQNIDRGIIELFGPNGIWLVFSDLSNKFNFKYTQYLDNKGHFKNFFKITFITLCFIYFLILLYQFLFNTIIFFQEEINSYNIILQKEFEFFCKKISYELNIPKFFEDISIHFQKDLGLGIIKLSQLFNIIYYPTYMGKVNPYFNYALLHELSLSYNQSLEDIITNDINTKISAAKEEVKGLQEIFFHTPGHLDMKCLSPEFFEFYGNLCDEEQNLVFALYFTFSSLDLFDLSLGLDLFPKGCKNLEESVSIFKSGLYDLYFAYNSEHFNAYRDAVPVIKNIKAVYGNTGFKNYVEIPRSELDKIWLRFLDVWCPVHFMSPARPLFLGVYVLQTAGRPLHPMNIDLMIDTMCLHTTRDFVLKIEEILKTAPTNTEETLILLKNFLSFFNNLSYNDQDIVAKVLFYKGLVGSWDIHWLTKQFRDVAVSQIGGFDCSFNRLKGQTISALLDRKDFVQKLMEIPFNNPVFFMELLKQDQNLLKEKQMLDLLIQSTSSDEMKDLLKRQDQIIYEKLLVHFCGEDLTDCLSAAYNISLINDFLAVKDNSKIDGLVIIFTEIILNDLKIINNLADAMFFAEYMANDLAFAEEILLKAGLLSNNFSLSEFIAAKFYVIFGEEAINDFNEFYNLNKNVISNKKIEKALTISPLRDLFETNFIVKDEIFRKTIFFFAKDSFFNGFSLNTVLQDQKFIEFLNKLPEDEKKNVLKQLELANTIACGDKEAFFRSDIFNSFLNDVYSRRMFLFYQDFIIDWLFLEQDLNKVLFRYLVLDYMRQHPCADATEIMLYLHFGLFSDVEQYKELAMTRKEDFK